MAKNWLNRWHLMSFFMNYLMSRWTVNNQLQGQIWTIQCISTFDVCGVIQDYIFVFPSCRRASPAAVKETSMTDLENKAETTPSAQTAPVDTDKPEVDLPVHKLAGSQFVLLCLWSESDFSFFHCRRRCHLWTEADIWANNILNKQSAFSTVSCEVISVLFTVRLPMISWHGI